MFTCNTIRNLTDKNHRPEQTDKLVLKDRAVLMTVRHSHTDQFIFHFYTLKYNVLAQKQNK